MSLFGSKTAAKKSPAKAADKKAETSMKDLYGEVAAKPKKSAMKSAGTVNDAYRILLSPLVTEKATTLHAVNKYVFVVAKGANKISVARAIKSAYGVNPVRVNILNVGGKVVTRGSNRGQRSDWRKAVVTLAKGESIKIYEGV